MLEVAQAVIRWMTERGRLFVTKSGDPSVGLQILGEGVGRYPLFIKANGRLAVTFSYLLQRPEFADESWRASVAERILEIVGGSGKYGGPTGDVTIDLAAIADIEVREEFLSQIETLIHRMEN